MEQLEKEARELADQGVKELILVAQETTLYGKDLYGEKKLPELLRQEIRNGKYIESTAELYGFLENYSS